MLTELKRRTPAATETIRNSIMQCDVKIFMRRAKNVSDTQPKQSELRSARKSFSKQQERSSLPNSPVARTGGESRLILAHRRRAHSGNQPRVEPASPG